jgi:hypothetical protein
MIVMAISDHRAVMWFRQRPDETYVQNYWENLLTTLARPTAYRPVQRKQCSIENVS